MKAIFKQIGAALLLIGGFMIGFLFARKTEKPQTIVNNNYDKIKNKGQDNNVDTKSETVVNNDNKKQSSKKKFRLFGKKKKS